MTETKMKNSALKIIISIALMGMIGCANNKHEAFRDQSLPSGGHAKVFTATLVLGNGVQGDFMMIQCALDGSMTPQAKLKAATELFEMIRPSCEAMKLDKGDVYILKGQSSQGDFDLISFKRDPKNNVWEPKTSSGFSVEGPATKQ